MVFRLACGSRKGSRNAVVNREETILHRDQQQLIRSLPWTDALHAGGTASSSVQQCFVGLSAGKAEKSSKRQKTGTQRRKISWNRNFPPRERTTEAQAPQILCDTCIVKGQTPTSQRSQGNFVASKERRNYSYSLAMKLSGLQREVLALYRGCLREARKKPLVNIRPLIPIHIHWSSILTYPRTLKRTSDITPGT